MTFSKEEMLEVLHIKQTQQIMAIEMPITGESQETYFLYCII